MSSSQIMQILRNFLNISITIFLVFFISVNLFTLAQFGLERLAGM